MQRQRAARHADHGTRKAAHPAQNGRAAANHDRTSAVRRHGPNPVIFTCRHVHRPADEDIGLSAFGDIGNGLQELLRVRKGLRRLLWAPAIAVPVAAGPGNIDVPARRDNVRRRRPVRRIRHEAHRLCRRGRQYELNAPLVQILGRGEALIFAVYDNFPKIVFGNR